MSSILKALKKLEEEKAARSGNTADIAGAILKTGRRGKKPPRWLVPAGMLAIAVVAVLATYAAMGGFSSRPAAVAPPPTPQPSPRMVATIPPTPAAALPQIPRVAPQPPSPLPPVAKKVPPPATPVSAPKAAPVEEKTLPGAPSPPQATAGIGKEEPTPHPSSAAPVLSVSGIAWQKDSASRLAVVNGTSVTQGAMVAGARVEEIFPDRVRFSLGHGTFEVPLGKSSGEGR